MSRFVITAPVWQRITGDRGLKVDAFVSDVTCEVCGWTVELALQPKEAARTPTTDEIQEAAALTHPRCGKARA